MSASSFIYTGLKGLSGEKTRMWGRPCSRHLQEVEDPFPCFLTAMFTPGEFQGKVREIDERSSTVRVTSEHDSERVPRVAPACVFFSICSITYGRTLLS